MSVVGRSRPRIDAVERVTGAARYTGDVKLPGMAYARVLRSPHPHARITDIDTRRAREMPGVYAVFTFPDRQTDFWIPLTPAPATALGSSVGFAQ